MNKSYRKYPLLDLGEAPTDSAHIERLQVSHNELLAALEQLVVDMESEIHSEYDGTSKLKARLAESDYARRAIAKAKGGQA